MAFLERPFFDAEASAFPHVWNYQGGNCRSGRQRRYPHFGFVSLSCAHSVLAFFPLLRTKKRWSQGGRAWEGSLPTPRKGGISWALVPGV